MASVVFVEDDMNYSKDRKDAMLKINDGSVSLENEDLQRTESNVPPALTGTTLVPASKYLLQVPVRGLYKRPVS
jgi:hypothetical protein